MRRGPRVAIIAVLAVISAAAVFYGPMALNAWWFLRDVAEHRQSTIGGVDRAQAIALTCAQCHGEQGNSRNGFYPALAGQPETYLLTQLQQFADGRRKSSHMQPLAVYLPEADLKLISRYYATRQVVAESSDSGSAKVAVPVPALVKQCATCHGDRLQGSASPMVAPRLSGQGQQYLVQQLMAFRSGDRLDPSGTMAAVAKSLDPLDIEAVANAAAAHHSAAAQ
jgi:cytochrome c553